MDPNVQQQPQYYYAPGAPAGTAPPGYYAPVPQAAGGASDAANGYVLPMQPQPQMMYYAPPAHGYAYPAPGYAYYQPPEAAFAALSLSGQALLPMQQSQQQQQQPQQTPGASSTTSNGSQPRAASTPIPPEEPASLAPTCNPAMIPMPVMYTQMPQYYPMPPGYEGAPMMPMMYQDPATGQMMQMQPMQQQQQPQQQHYMQARMMSADPNAAPENIDDISQISHHSSPDTYMDVTPCGQQQRHPTTPVSSMQRRRISLPPPNQNNSGHMISSLMPSNYKTRMCTQWLEKRECSMGGSCKFAHGNEELRLPERPFRAINNPKYKTKMCKNFEPGATGLCAYADRCEYIHPNDREYTAYKARIEALARARGDFPRFKAMFDEVPGVPRRGRGGSTSGAAGDEENKSVRSSADSSCDSRGVGRGAASPPPTRHRRGSARGDGGYLGSAMPLSMTRSAIRMGAGADAPHHNQQHHHHQQQQQSMRRGFGGGSMYNLASGTYTDRDEYRTRLSRVPSASNVASLGLGANGGRSRYGAPTKFNRRASMCHLDRAVDY
ncbi:hypothetical protein PMAYCL1PPCAC_25122 [Pristionchus mayeri]|uniref:C3H1-type domain-containing protein n=1 Tax=Pristionchus mayeri TaxID=1317129 RepID=A0AAN5I720_9BILA|nr:hypothetical protein PMAYCL1PPCAC_25122 [Pristionchus mayeri]